MPSARARLMVKNIIRRRILPVWYPSTTRRFQRVTGQEATVLMCLWNRPERLEPVLRMLDAQDHPPGVRLFLWNNARADHHRYREIIDLFAAKGSLVSVSLVKSPFNVGSIGRFYWARWLSRRSGPRPVLVLDDDQDIMPDFVSVSLSEARPKTLAAWWAFVVTGEYWERRPARRDDLIDHIGPGGMVADSSLFAERGFFTSLPDRYWMLDDIWVSGFAIGHGYRLAKLDVDIEFVLPETNQYHAQGSIKPEFFTYLAPMRTRGGRRP